MRAALTILIPTLIGILIYFFIIRSEQKSYEQVRFEYHENEFYRISNLFNDHATSANLALDSGDTVSAERLMFMADSLYRLESQHKDSAMYYSTLLKQ